MIIMYTRRTVDTSNLAELRSICHTHGGAIVQYERVFSVLVYTQRTKVFEWVGPQTTRRAVGFKQALWCFFLGWWSVMGFFCTINAIISNLMGGIDVTRVVAASPSDYAATASILGTSEQQAELKRQQYVFLAVLFVLLVIAIIFCVVPYV